MLHLGAKPVTSNLGSCTQWGCVPWSSDTSLVWSQCLANHLLQQGEAAEAGKANLITGQHPLHWQPTSHIKLGTCSEGELTWSLLLGLCVFVFLVGAARGTDSWQKGCRCGNGLGRLVFPKGQEPASALRCMISSGINSET